MKELLADATTNTLKYAKPVLGTAALFYSTKWLINQRFRMVAKGERLIIETGTSKHVVFGPKTHLLPLFYQKLTLETCVTLDQLSYAIIQDELTGSVKIEQGPKILELSAYEKIKDGTIYKAISLMKNQYIKLKDKATGQIEMIKGEKGAFIPQPTQIDFYTNRPVDENCILEALNLKVDQYVYIEDKQTGKITLEKGSKSGKLIFPEAYQEFVALPHPHSYKQIRDALNLDFNQYIEINNKDTGVRRLEAGEKMIFLQPNENFVTKSPKIAESLKATNYCFIQQKDGSIRSVKGEGLVFPQVDEIFIPDPYTGQNIRDAIVLRNNEYCKIENTQTGEIRVEKGENLIFLTPFEKLVNREIKQAINLTCYEYVKIINQQTGQLRTEKGEKLVFLGPFDEIVNNKKHQAIEVDDQTAVLIRDKQTGQQKLVKSKQLFFPDDNEEVIEVRNLIKLAEHQCCIVRDQTGKDSFYFGKNVEQSCFFLEPYHEIVSCKWSRGRRREHRDLIIQKIDLRPMFMSFEFNCRTSDNVELILEGTLFWQIIDPVAMNKFTGDTTGDVCSHARSVFIQAVSQVDFKEFMQNFNQIASRGASSSAKNNNNSDEKSKSKPDDSSWMPEFNDDSDPFYQQRGVKIHNLEVTGYRCAEAATSKVLNQIIQETTNRLNRLQQQESASEVKLMQINALINEEKAKAELLEFQKANSDRSAEMVGLEEAHKVRTFLESLDSTVESLDSRIELWKILRKNDALRAVSSNNTKLIYTPNDADLSLKFEG